MQVNGYWKSLMDSYDPCSGITDNPSENYNDVLKQENDWKELSVDMLVLGFHFLQNFDYF